ncbi:MAG: PilN domain-containing protein [Mariprofundaceae bacterium]
MIRINLLPYRPERRQKQILHHISATFGTIAIVAAALFMLNIYITSQLTDLQTEYSQLQTENRILMKKIGKIRNLEKLRVDVESKLDLVDELQQGRFESLNTLHELAKLIPENVWLVSVVDNAGKLKFNGFAESNKAVANFMRALDQSAIFDQVDLQVIQRNVVDDVPVRSFNLTLNRLIKPLEEVKSAGGKL